MEDIKLPLMLIFPWYKEEMNVLTSEAENNTRDGSFCESQSKDKYFKIRKLLVL